MAVKLRLQRQGRKKSPFYHIVVADARAPRDGRFIEKLGTYNPLTVPATIALDRDRAYDWLMKGAQPTDTVRAILRFKGVLYRKHLAVGVKKGALTEEQAEARLIAWIEEKESRIAKRKEETAEKRRQFIAAVDGSPKPKAAKPVAEKTAKAAVPEDAVAASVAETPVLEAAAAEAATETPALQEAVAETPEVAAAEEATTEAAEETPAVEEAVAEASEVAAAVEEAAAEVAEETPAMEEAVAEASEVAAAVEEAAAEVAEETPAMEEAVAEAPEVTAAAEEATAEAAEEIPAAAEEEKKEE